jgi:succinate dehydrogenase/fumarate reductase flavoprotein subunit
MSVPGRADAGGVVWRLGSIDWDDEADTVVIGAGAGGLATGVAAADAGASVLVVEKAGTYGGTAWKSGGGSWVPNNHFQRELGITDRREDVLRYLARTARPTRYRAGSRRLGLPDWEFAHLEAFYDDAATVFEHLDAAGVLEQCHIQDFPDYFQHLDEDVITTGRLIVPRYPDGEPGDGPELMRQLKHALDQRGGRLLAEHRVVGAVIDDSGAVVGMVADTPAGRAAFRAERALVFASGGFTWNAELREAYLPGPVYGGCAVVTNEGDFVPIAQTLGAAMRNMNQFWGAPIIIDHAVKREPTALGTHTTVGDSMIHVNRYGVRALNEKALYNEKQRAMFQWDAQRLEYPNLLMFVIWDQRTMDRCAGNPYDGGLIPAPGGSDSHMVRGETLEELAAELDAHAAAFAAVTGGVRLSDDFLENLTATIERFNEFARTGRDEEFHRGETPTEQFFNAISIDSAGFARGTTDALDSDRPRSDSTARAGSGNDGEETASVGVIQAVANPTMHPLSVDGPYYGAILVPGTLDTKGGPRTDLAGRVLDHAGAPIRGLYAVGNCAASPSAQGYWGPGCTLGLIITQAWRTGRHIAGAPLT